MTKGQIGDKIRKFRTRAGMSQLDLELEIGTSSGSISRIESGATNPTKETILKIASVFGLSAVETASLFDIDLDINKDTVSDYMKNIIRRELITERTLKHFIAEKLNEVEQKMDYIGSSLSLVDTKQDIIQLKFFSDNWVAFLANIVVPRSKLYAELSLSEVETMTKTKIAVLKNRTILGKKLSEFASPPLYVWQAKAVQFLWRMKMIIALPIPRTSGDILGAINIASANVISPEEVDTLRSFANYLGGILEVILYDNLLVSIESE
ncbi:MAG: helix-turn-helix domain-containing protein [Candidatus Dojkabacteria bacterium]